MNINCGVRIFHTQEMIFFKALHYFLPLVLSDAKVGGS